MDSEKRHMLVWFKNNAPAMGDKFDRIWQAYQKSCVINADSKCKLEEIYLLRLNNVRLFREVQDVASREYATIFGKGGRTI